MLSASKPRGAKSLGDALQGLVKDLGIGPKLHEYEAVLRWDEAVGPHIAKVATAAQIQRGVLVVRVNNATWRYELTMRKTELIGKINAVIGENVVKDIRFQ
jgi:predicted nucleic acid-binding Zn ribbon protein